MAPDLRGFGASSAPPEPKAYKPAQQRASAYTHLLSRPDAERLLQRNDHRLLWRFLGDGSTTPRWLDDATRRRYREHWSQGPTGARNLYRVTPLKPPRPSTDAQIRIRPRGTTNVTVPTLLLWGMDDTAPLPGLLDGLHDHVPQPELQRLPGAWHWVLHEAPETVVEHMTRFIAPAAFQS